jgi:hypothetical protein
LSLIAQTSPAIDPLAQFGVAGIAIAALAAVIRVLWKELGKKDDVIAARDLRIHDLQEQRVDRAERSASLLGDVAKLLPTLLERTPTPEQVERMTDALDALPRTIAPTRKRVVR